MKEKEPRVVLNVQNQARQSLAVLVWAARPVRFARGFDDPA